MKRLLSAMLACTFTLASFASNVIYHDVKNLPLYGTVVPDSETPYVRVPDSLKTKIRAELYELGTNSAGIFMRFSSNASTMKAKWVSTLEREMNHMAPSGIRGFDLYVMEADGSWDYMNAVRPIINKKQSTATIFSGLKPEMREYLLYFPLYDGVDSLYIGTDSAAVLEMPKVDLPKREHPIVMYGTSILQGACASRPGMCHTNMLVRELNREVYNFGFSGNGRLDLEIAELMVSIDAGLYVIDNLPNVTPQQLTDGIDPFYQLLRSRRPDVPILFIENPIFPMSKYNEEEYNTIIEKNRILKEFYENLKAQGVKEIYYLEAEKVLTEDREGTIDGYHFTDLGFRRYADTLLPIIQTIAK